MPFTQHTIDKWFSKFRQYFFRYKEGFYELPYLSNSPEAIISSLAKMPFIDHSVEKQRVRSDNNFAKSEMYYQEIEDGLWVMHGDTEYKVNINFRSIDDKAIPSDYYVLNLKIAHPGHRSKMSIINGVSYRKCSWVLYKPKANTFNCHFKGTRELWFAVFFNERWLEEVLSKTAFFKTGNLKHFFESEAQYIVWPEDIAKTRYIHKSLLDIFEAREKTGVIDYVQLRKEAIKQIKHFARKYPSDEQSTHAFSIQDADHKKMLKVEKLLQQNISSPFMGIEELSRQAGISPTKLKSDFKSTFGRSVFQYFRQKQMEYAYLLLERKSLSVKEIALQLGYENASKFSAAFKKHFDVLPSDVKTPQ